MNRSKPTAVFADNTGNILDHPDAPMTGRSWNTLVAPAPDELIPLPEGSKFFTIPHARPVSHRYDGREYEIALDGYRGIQPVAAFMSPAYTRTLLPAYRPGPGYATLPLWAYGAVGWDGDDFAVAGIRVDDNDHWNPERFDDRELAPLVDAMLNEFPENRLVDHLSRCALEYHCFAAKNLFYRRWEMPLPTSPACNANCIGCLSLQPGECCASMQRIGFVPSPEEIAEITVPHLEHAEEPLASFGQGCEGDPLLQAETVEKSIRLIRQRTTAGTVNVNTNGSRTGAVVKLCKAGLDSIRFSMNSCTPDLYTRYFRPSDYTFDDVRASIRVARDAGLYISLNLFVFPGLTDREEEIETLYGMVREFDIDLIQLRNLNIDPEQYIAAMPDPQGRCIGIKPFVDGLRRDFPRLALGYFNKPKERFGR